MFITLSLLSKIVCSLWSPNKKSTWFGSIFSGLSLSGLSLARFLKIAADILMAFTGEFVTKEIEYTKSL